MVLADFSNFTGPLETFRAITLSLLDAHPHFRGIPKKYWSKYSKPSFVTARNARARHREIAQVSATCAMRVKRGSQDSEGTRGRLLGTFPPKANYACARTTRERGARGACMCRHHMSSAQGPFSSSFQAMYDLQFWQYQIVTETKISVTSSDMRYRQNSKNNSKLRGAIAIFMRRLH